MNTKQKLIKRLNNGFGLKYDETTYWSGRLGSTNSKSVRWILDEIKCYDSATVVLRDWKRWVLANDELTEYIPGMESEYAAKGWKVENKNNMLDTNTNNCGACKKLQCHYCKFLKKNRLRSSLACDHFKTRKK